jgi:type VI protein secretion system component VasK
MQESWHLSKSVPITFILAIVMQTVALVWYVSTLDASIKQNARDITKHEARVEALEKTVQSQAVTLGRIDENLKAIRDLVEQMARQQVGR